MTLTHTENQVHSEHNLSYPNLDSVPQISNPNPNIQYAPKAESLPSSLCNVKQALQQLDITNVKTAIKQMNINGVKQAVQEIDISSVKQAMQQIDVATTITEVKEIANKVKDKVQEKVDEQPMLKEIANKVQVKVQENLQNKQIPKFSYKAKFILFFIGIVLSIMTRFIPALSQLITIEQVKQWYGLALGVKESAKSIVKETVMDYGRSLPGVSWLVGPMVWVGGLFV